jgi:hypothetical protein
VEDRGIGSLNEMGMFGVGTVAVAGGPLSKLLEVG